MSAGPGRFPTISGVGRGPRAFHPRPEASWPRRCRSTPPRCIGGQSLAGDEETLAAPGGGHASRLARWTSTVLSSRTTQGVDLLAVNLIVSLDHPADSATCIHRVGRMGRLSSKGVAASLVTQAELERLGGVDGGEFLPLPDAVPSDFLTSQGQDGDPAPWDRRGAVSGGFGTGGGDERGAPTAEGAACGHRRGRSAGDPRATSALDNAEERGGRHVPRELRRGNSLLNDRELRHGSVMERLVQRLQEIQMDNEGQGEGAGGQGSKQGREKGHRHGHEAVGKDQSAGHGNHEGTLGAMGGMGVWPPVAPFGGVGTDRPAAVLGVPPRGVFPAWAPPAWGPWAAMMATWEWEWYWRHQWWKWALAQGQSQLQPQSRRTAGG